MYTCYLYVLANPYSTGYRHAFYLATLGGVEALELQGRVRRNLRVGLEFGAIVLSACS